MVLLSNDGILPLPDGTASVALIGGHADRGVLAGGGSSQGAPPNGVAAEDPLRRARVPAALNAEVYYDSSPLAELRRLLPDTTIEYDPGCAPGARRPRSHGAATWPSSCVTKFESEGYDSPDLTPSLAARTPSIEAVAAANPNTVVVLETGNPVAMPWLAQRARGAAGLVPGPGSAAARSPRCSPAPSTPRAGCRSRSRPIARPDCRGRSSPASGTRSGTPVTDPLRRGRRGGLPLVRRDRGETPLFAFGHGLGYTTFELRNRHLEVDAGEVTTR